MTEIPAFSESGNPDIVPDLCAHGSEHTGEILRLLSGGSIGDFGFVSRHAARRAEQRFPLEATLHAYRCGHKIFLRRLTEATLAAIPAAMDGRGLVAALADFAIEYTDAISIVAASSYVALTRLIADVAGDQRAQLLAILLDGYDESDGRVADILRDAGYTNTRLSFTVLLARSVDPTEMLNPDRARRIVDAIDEALHSLSARRVIDIRDNKVSAMMFHRLQAFPMRAVKHSWHSTQPTSAAVLSTSSTYPHSNSCCDWQVTP